MPLQVELVSAEDRVWSGEASRVVARTTEGEIGILAGHVPVLAVPAVGEVRITGTDGQPAVATLEDGFLSVEHDRVTVVSDTAAMHASPSR